LRFGSRRWGPFLFVTADRDAVPPAEMLVDARLPFDPWSLVFRVDRPTLAGSASRTVGFLDYFFGPDVDEAWAREAIAFDDRVGEEDRALVESVQRGVGSGLLDGGQLLPESERLIALFRVKVTDSLT